MTDLSELIERVRQATGPDRELDLAIADQLLEYQDRKLARIRTGYDFTASIDAALALAERALPGRWRLMLMKALHEINKAPDIYDISQMPRFIILALLLALESQS